MMNPWIYVMVGGIFETVWAVCMKESDGFTNLLWIIPTIFFIFVSTLFLNKGLSANLPSGMAYSVWVGIGAVGSLIAGLVIFGEGLNAVKLIFVAMILVGVIGIQFNEEPSEQS